VSDYDFSSLNDKEFEVFCVDILSESLGVRFERFKSGKDAGVDGRYFSDSGREVVLQCKHWLRTPIEKLLKHLQTVEIAKVARLKPARYLLAVSYSLSRRDKQSIVQVLSPFLVSADDVYGREDLNDALRKHPEVERRHYKLWMHSAEVLNYFINKPALDRSALLINEARLAIRMYVTTENHSSALRKLESLGVVIITGEPGIGKTMLAQQLVLHYAGHGFQVVAIGDNLKDAEALFTPQENQILYFDDFLGRNYLEALSGHEGNRIVQFLRRVSGDRKKRFVLTSRSTILNQGKLLIDNFGHSKTERNEFELALTSLTELDRAKILYNHIWYGNLSEEFIAQLYAQRRYRLIVQHRNFNPRLISFITDADRLADVSASNYWDTISASLENPADIWANPFEAQQDDFGRAIVLLVTLERRAIAQDELAEAYERFLVGMQGSGLTGRRDFIGNIRQLTGSLLKRVVFANVELPARLDLFNPSLGDYVLRRYSADLPGLRRGFLSLRSDSSLETLRSLSTQGMISRIAYLMVLDAIMTDALSKSFFGYSPSYIASIALLAINEGAEIPDLDLKECAEFVLREEIPVNFIETAQLVIWGRGKGFISDDRTVQFILSTKENNPNIEEIEALIGIWDGLSEACVGRDEAYSVIRQVAVNYFCDSGADEFPMDDVFGNVDPEDSNGAEENLVSLIRKRIERIGIDLDRSEISEIVSAFDIESRQHDYFFSSGEGGSYGSHATTRNYSDEIDDLFDRR